MAVLMVQKNIIKRLIKEIQNAKRRATCQKSLSKLPNIIVDYSTFYNALHEGGRSFVNGHAACAARSAAQTPKQSYSDSCASVLKFTKMLR